VDVRSAGIGSLNQSTQTTHVTRPKILKINWTTEPTGWLSGLYVLEKNRKKESQFPRGQKEKETCTREKEFH
jgi:hypothetical protein